MNDMEPALQLLVLGLPCGQEDDYAEKLRNTFEKGVIMGHKPYYQRSAILFVQGFHEAILVMRTLIHPNSKFKGICATLRPQEIIRLKNYSETLVSKTREKAPSDFKSNLLHNTNNEENQEQNNVHLKTNFEELKENNEMLVKVFVGCLPKGATDDMVLSVFKNYGSVAAAHILRDNNGQTKYSAFVYYSEMSMALEAIRNLDKKYIMPDGTRPIEVRLAEKRCFRVPKSRDLPPVTKDPGIDQRKSLTSEALIQTQDPPRTSTCETKPTPTPKPHELPNRLHNIPVNYYQKIEELLYLLRRNQTRRLPQIYYE